MILTAFPGWTVPPSCSERTSTSTGCSSGWVRREKRLQAESAAAKASSVPRYLRGWPICQ